MINLSQMGRERGDYSFLGMIRSLNHPDVYLAENVADFQEEAPQIKFPWYKRFPYAGGFRERAYIIFENIGLKRLVEDGRAVPHWFVLHDSSGQRQIYWNANHKRGLFPAFASFRQLQKTSCLRSDDWVCEVFARYLLKSDLLSVVDVQKYDFSNRLPEKETLAERTRRLFPLAEPALQGI